MSEVVYNGFSYILSPKLSIDYFGHDLSHKNRIETKIRKRIKKVGEDFVSTCQTSKDLC